MEIFDVFSMNGIENYLAAGENFLENVILKVSQTHFPRISTSRRGQCPPPLASPWGGINCSRGAVKYPDLLCIKLEIIELFCCRLS